MRWPARASVKARGGAPEASMTVPKCREVQVMPNPEDEKAPPAPVATDGPEIP
jgi:hypothetical protein